MKVNVPHVAKLANLPLSEKEIPKFEHQLSDVLDYVKKLEEVDLSADKAGTKHVEPTSQVTGLENVLREDMEQPSLSQTDALSNTKSTKNGMFQVKGVFENE